MSVRRTCWRKRMACRLMAAVVWCLAMANASAQTLDLGGYLDATGAISVQRGGDTVDPYFALQALLLAQDHGLDISAQAQPFARWLAQQYRQTGQLGRYCKQDQVWVMCKSADADDASLALWLHFLQQLPPSVLRQERLQPLQAQALRALRQLQDPRTGLYRVSARIPHSLFMDNLEVWSARPDARLAQRIQATFWDATHQRYRVSTQTDHPHPGSSFYPDATAQIYPLLMRFGLAQAQQAGLYAQWMRQHRATWLRQIVTDFPWGVIAIVAWQQGDLHTVRCWQKRALPQRHSLQWTVTDEAVAQILPPLTAPPPDEGDCT